MGCVILDSPPPYGIQHVCKEIHHCIDVRGKVAPGEPHVLGGIDDHRQVMVSIGSAKSTNKFGRACSAGEESYHVTQ